MPVQFINLRSDGASGLAGRLLRDLLIMLGLSVALVLLRSISAGASDHPGPPVPAPVPDAESVPAEVDRDAAVPPVVPRSSRDLGPLAGPVTDPAGIVRTVVGPVTGSTAAPSPDQLASHLSGAAAGTVSPTVDRIVPPVDAGAAPVSPLTAALAPVTAAVAPLTPAVAPLTAALAPVTAAVAPPVDPVLGATAPVTEPVLPLIPPTVDAVDLAGPAVAAPATGPGSVGLIRARAPWLPAAAATPPPDKPFDRPPLRPGSSCSHDRPAPGGGAVAVLADAGERGPVPHTCPAPAALMVLTAPAGTPPFSPD